MTKEDETRRFGLKLADALAKQNQLPMIESHLKRIEAKLDQILDKLGKSGGKPKT